MRHGGALEAGLAHLLQSVEVDLAVGVVQGVEQVVTAEDEAALDGGVQLAGGVEQARAVAAGDAEEEGIWYFI